MYIYSMMYFYIDLCKNTIIFIVDLLIYKRTYVSVSVLFINTNSYLYKSENYLISILI